MHVIITTCTECIPQLLTCTGRNTSHNRHPKNLQFGPEIRWKMTKSTNKEATRSNRKQLFPSNRKFDALKKIFSKEILR